MKRWALIENQKVANVVEQETEPQVFGSWVETPANDIGPGWGYVNGKFIDPRPPVIIPNIITKVAFRFRLTDAEYVSILSTAKTDVAVEAWVETFNMVSSIDLDNQRTKDGVANLVTKNLLTQARATTILTAPVQEGERP
jgi:hypothetical protein